MRTEESVVAEIGRMDIWEWLAREEAKNERDQLIKPARGWGMKRKTARKRMKKRKEIATQAVF